MLFASNTNDSFQALVVLTHLIVTFWEGEVDSGKGGDVDSHVSRAALVYHIA
jgi:hypothetical protein